MGEFNTQKVTNKTDIWSCGCVFYEVIALKKAYELEHNDMGQLFKNITNQEYPLNNLKLEEKYQMLNLVIKK